MAGPLIVRISIRFPWWAELYIGALKFFYDLGVIDLDPDKAANFVMRHTKCVVEPVAAKK